MLRKLNPVLALAAGLLGGILSRYLAPPPVHAQAPATQAQSTPAPEEIRAQSFTLVDGSGAVVGTFRPLLSVAPGLPGVFDQGPARRERGPQGVVLLDRSGRELWRAGGSIVRPASQ